jgi:hypothetical protein
MRTVTTLAAMLYQAATVDSVDRWKIDSEVTDRPRWAALFCPNQASAARQASKAFLALVLQRHSVE